MCGITGVIGERLPGPEALQAMADALAHRGPDDSGIWTDPAAGVALGHRRLSIIDLSPAGHQPMHSACGRYVIVFNGEIYNHPELRHELDLSEGAARPPWRGHSDTETLLAGLAAWGMEGTLARLVGMYAFAIWDRDERRLHLARDRFGEKPLYYGWSRGNFLFGSELSALRRAPGFAGAVDRDVLGLYLERCYVPAPYSIYRGIYKLEPGCLLSLSISGASSPPSAAPRAPFEGAGFRLSRYWSLANAARRGLADPIGDPAEAAERLESVLARSVRQQSISDVPLGAFLSGGIDSSTIVALMQTQAPAPVRTFTIGFAEAAFNEAAHARAVAEHLGTDHTELTVTPEEARDVIPRLPALYAEPFADSSQIPTFLVSQLARRQVAVALSGDAGDELFAGYNRYFWGRRIWSRVAWMPRALRRELGGWVRRIPAGAWDRLGGTLPGPMRIARLGDKAHKLAARLVTVRDLDDLYRSLVTEWSPQSGIVPGARLLPTALEDHTLVDGIAEPEHRMMLWDALTYLPDDILHKVDRAAMGVSLETRVPFLDHRVAELAWRIPLGLKIRDGKGKWILRQVLYRHVPPRLIERPKAGFGIPVGQWLRGPLCAWAEDLLSPSRLGRQGLLAPRPVREKWLQHRAGTHDWTPQLWSVLMLQSWLDTWEQ